MSIVVSFWFIAFWAIILILAMMIAGCTKNEPCQIATMETYSNYNGYWNYCRYQTNELNTDMVLTLKNTITLCPGDGYYIGLDSTFCSVTNCPRSGQVHISNRIIVK